MSDMLVTKLFHTVDSCSWDALSDLFHPDVVYERPGYKPIIGVDQLLLFYREERVIESGDHHIEHIVIDGMFGACWGRFVGVKKDGSSIDETFADVYGFEDGKIKTRRTHFFRPAC